MFYPSAALLTNTFTELKYAYSNFISLLTQLLTPVLLKIFQMAGQIDMNAQSELMASFEENL